MINITKTMKIILISTLIAFSVCFVSLGISFVVEVVNNYSDEVDLGGGGGGKPTPQQPSTPAGNVTSEEGVKTGIKLPSVTQSKTYLGVTDDKTKDISAETSIKSAAVALIDITDNRTVAGKNMDTKIYPASMTKVMTLLVACENAKDPNALLTVTEAMVQKYNKSENKGASVSFTWSIGDQVTVEDALHMVIYKSDTYACWLLADYVAGGEAEFVDLMNDKAGVLGLTSTNFTNCTGLYNENHYTTAREMSAIMAAVMNNETATAVITRTDMYTADIYQNGEKNKTVSMWSDWYRGRLEEYKWGAAAAYYAGNGSDIKIVAGKTGWETVPTSCFVTSAYDDVTGRKYVCVQVGRIDKNQDSISPKISTDDTRLTYQKYAVEE